MRLRQFSTPLATGLLLGVYGLPLAQTADGNEPNLAVPAGYVRYQADVMPDRIIATPAQDASRGFAVNWRTADGVDAPLLEIRTATDSPDVGTPRRITATSRSGSAGDRARYHRADVDGLTPGTLYMFRVQGKGTWSGWRQLRTGGAAGTALSLLYFGDTQNKNLSHVSRVVREAMRHAPDATLTVFAGDLVSEAVDNDEWGEWFEATGDLPDVMLVAPAIGNHEYRELFEDTPQERRELGAGWTRGFALPGNGAEGEQVRETTYWFDAQGVRFVVLDGTSALDLGTVDAQAQWLDRVLSHNPQPWTIALVHQPMYSPRGRGASDRLRAAWAPVFDRHGVDLVLQGHDHTYGRRGGDNPNRALPQYVVSVAGPKQYRLSEAAKSSMNPTAEDTQLFQVLRVDGKQLRYQARTATGRLYDDFRIVRDARGQKKFEEIREGRIAPRDCSHRDATLGGRTDRCWE